MTSEGDHSKKDAAAASEPATEERRRTGERRGTASSSYDGPERRGGLDRRRGPGRRRSDIRRQAEEGEITGELLEFVMAMDEYKRKNNRPFPTWSEVFELIHYLGYRKVADRAAHINHVQAEAPVAAGTK